MSHSQLIAARRHATAEAVEATAAAVPWVAAAPEYSADDAAQEWARRPVPVVARLLEIAAAFGSWWVKSTMHRDPQRAAADMREVGYEPS